MTEEFRKQIDYLKEVYNTCETYLKDHEYSKLSGFMRTFSDSVDVNALKMILVATQWHREHPAIKPVRELLIGKFDSLMFVLYNKPGRIKPPGSTI